MKGRNPTAAQLRFHTMLCSLGCIACVIDGRPISSQVSVHHIDGRTKPWAHWTVLPLCAGHHQDGTGARGLIAIHPWKARFVIRYGSQETLLVRCIDQLIVLGYVVPADALQAANHPCAQVAA